MPDPSPISQSHHPYPLSIQKIRGRGFVNGFDLIDALPPTCPGAIWTTPFLTDGTAVANEAGEELRVKTSDSMPMLERPGKGLPMRILEGDLEACKVSFPSSAAYDSQHGASTVIQVHPLEIE